MAYNISKSQREIHNVKETYLSVVMPVYNGEATINKVISRIKQILEPIIESTGSSFDIIVVDDGSIDGTYTVLKELEKNDNRVTAISYKPNKGKGYAIKTGILSSKGRIVMFIDGDLEASPYLIANYIQELETCDLVIGSRRHPLSKGHRHASRRFLSTAFRIISSNIAGVHDISDTQAGLKMGRGELLRKIFEITTIRRYAFDVEFLLIATLLNANIREMPIIDENKSKGFKVKEMVRMFIDILRISYLYKRKQWYQQQLISLSPNQPREMPQTELTLTQ